MASLLLPLVPGCAYQVPLSQSEDAVELEIAPEEMILKGPSMASTRRLHLLFVGFGQRNSFMRAEQQAIEAADAELLVNRIRLKHFEGFLIPSMWLQALGVGDATDISIIGWEIYTVAGTAVRVVPSR